MTRSVRLMLLPALALIVALLGESVIARQEEEQGPLPGVGTETVGRSPVAGQGSDDLVLLRVTLEPGASIPASYGPRAAVILLESGRVGIALDAGAADLTLPGRDGTIPLALDTETILAPGDAVSYGAGARLAWHNRGDAQATMLYAVVAADDALVFMPATPENAATFSVETFACPEGMSLVTLETDACEPSTGPLVQWSLASDQFAAPLDIDQATVAGATTTWDGLPEGAYFIDLTTESFAPGYGDYFIPSSNQVTRQDERMTRIYYNSVSSTGSINAYVFTAGPSPRG